MKKDFSENRMPRVRCARGAFDLLLYGKKSCSEPVDTGSDLTITDPGVVFTAVHRIIQLSGWRLCVAGGVAVLIAKTLPASPLLTSGPPGRDPSQLMVVLTRLQGIDEVAE